MILRAANKVVIRNKDMAGTVDGLVIASTVRHPTHPRLPARLYAAWPPGIANMFAGQMEFCWGGGKTAAPTVVYSCSTHFRLRQA